MYLRALACGLLLFAACVKHKAPRSREGFCIDWAAAACSDEVVSVCQAKSVQACRDAQSTFCRSLVADGFSDATGDECINAVKKAYEDADLKSAELATVLRLGPPCDQLVIGPKSQGDSCTSRSQCDTSIGLECVQKSNADHGNCEHPTEVGGGRNCEAAQKTCEPGFYCNGSNCIEAKSPGDTCTIQEECAPAGFCDDTGMCKKSLATSDPCTTDLECATGICYEFVDGKVCTDRLRLSRTDPICDDLR
jgi:hypothetical protein